MDLTFTEPETAFRDELRAWLGDNHPGEEPTGEDAEAYQHLLDIAARADVLEGIRQGLEEARQGKGRDIEEFVAEFEAKHGISG